MRKRAKKDKSQQRAKPIDDIARNDRAAADSNAMRPRSFFRDCLLGLVACIVFFAALEAGLRIAGIPRAYDKGDPYVGFSALQPLFTVTDGKASTAVPKRKYFNQVSFTARKKPGTMRIFCFGGSTTYGHPFDGRTAFPRWLGELLATSSPGKDFEVINAGGISYASYRILPLIEETLRFGPDLMVIYTGQNEFLERRTYSGLLDQGRALVTLRSVLERLHTYRGLELLLEPLVSRLLGDGDVRRSGSSASRRKATSPKSESTRPGMTVLQDELNTILDQSAGLDLYRRDEEFSRGVVQHFSYNLGKMLRMCREAGVPVVLVEPASNLKDFSPFKSEHGADLAAPARAGVDKSIKDAAELIEHGEFGKALGLLKACVGTDPMYAMTHYLSGKALLGLGRNREALESFICARDLDVCPLRATSSILEVIRRNAGDAASFIPFPNLLVEMPVTGADRSDILGNERFLDHVHPVIQGHQKLAESILQEIMRLGLVRPTRNLSRQDKDAIYTRVMESLDQSFFAMRDWNLAKTLYWAGKKDEALSALLRIVKPMDSHPGVHAMLASFLLDRGDYERAVEESEKAVKLSGNDPIMLYGLAAAYFASGRNDEAERTLRHLVDQGGQIPEAYSKLALIYLGSGRTDEAIGVLKSGLQKSPDEPTLLDAYGFALAVSGRPTEGIPWVLSAHEREPGNPQYLYDLAMMYALAGRKDEALESLQEAAANGYGDADKLIRDVSFESIRSDARFEAILRRLR
ncbi:MAG: tetratricopeptide repeat protein [Desulfomonilaceae bacterium]